MDENAPFVVEWNNGKRTPDKIVTPSGIEITKHYMRDGKFLSVEGPSFEYARLCDNQAIFLRCGGGQ